MTFTQITVENFLSYAQATLRLDGQGLVLVKGRVLGRPGISSNGAGKSALVIDALCYALFGRTPRGAEGTDVINRKVGKNCLVRLEGLDGDVPFVIERPQKYAGKNKVTMTRGGETFVGDVTVKAQIRTLLGGIDFDTFLAALVFGRVKFITQMTDADRKAVLEQLAGLTILSAALDKAKGEAGRLATARTEAAQAVELAVRAGEETARQIASLKPKAAQFETWRANTLATAEREQTEAREIAKTAVKAFTTIAAALKKAGTEKKAAEKALRDAEQPWIVAEQEMVEAQNALDKSKAAVAQLEAEATRLKRMPEQCPTCRQPTTEAKKQLILNLMRPISDAHLKRDLDAQVADKVQATLAATATAAKKAEDQVREWDQVLRTLEMDRQAKDRERLAATARLERATRVVEETKRAENTAAASLEEAMRRMVAHGAEAEAASATLAQVEHEQALTAVWLKGYGNAGLKSQLLDPVVPMLNEAAAKYSELMTDGALRVRFDTQAALKGGGMRDAFTVDVELVEDGVPYKTCSDGEKRRADIIASLALGAYATSRIGKPINFVVLDEIADHLDEAGVERLPQLLQALQQERSSIFAISHNDQLAAHFSKAIVIEQEGGISRLVEG